MKRLILFCGLLLLFCGSFAHAQNVCTSAYLNAGAGKVVNSNWKLIDCAAHSETTCHALTCSETFAPTNNFPIQKNDTIVWMWDLDTAGTVTAFSCTDNITGDVVQPIPSLQGGSSNFFSVTNGTGFLTGKYMWTNAAAAKASGYQMTCSGTTTGQQIADTDYSIMVFRQNGGGPSAGIDAFSPYQAGTTSGTCNQGPSGAGCPMVAQTITLNTANDLVIGGGNENGAPQQADSPFTVALDNNTSFNVAPYYYSVGSSSSGTGSVAFKNYDKNSGDNWASVVFALKPSAAPVLFFSDLVAGPASGNSDTTFSATGGAYVTLYGNFLDSPTAVQLNGSSCLTTVSAPTAWMWYERMVVKLGTGCTSGNFTVTTSAGTSNGIPFTVRSGNIFYVSTTGSDAAAGTFSAPWLTLLHARDTITAGATVYAENGVAATVDDGTGWNTCFLLDANAGTSGNSKAIVAYPGATATIGNVTHNLCTGIRSKGTGSNFWVFAELQLKGSSSAVNSYNDQDWRLVGNDMTCPNGDPLDQAGCLDPGGDGSANTFNYRIFGNNIHHAATNNTPGTVTTLYHGVYISEFHHDLDFGWNTVAFVMGGRCIQQHVNVGPGDYDLHVHDNVIHDCPEDGIVSTTTSPSLGTVEFYNNVIYNAGIGPNPIDGGGGWNCMNIQGYYNTTVETGTIHVYNNTFYGCGTITNPNDGNGERGNFLWAKGNSTGKFLDYHNNISYVAGAPNYFASDSDTGNVSGANNLFFGNGTPSIAGLTGNVVADPSFVSTSAPDFHLLSSGSPANGAGTTTVPVPLLDHDGLTRPSPPAIGAYEFQSGGGAPPGAATVPAFTGPAGCSSGAYSGPSTSATISDSNTGTHVACYRVGATPATNGIGTGCAIGSTQYTGAISVMVTETINAIAGASTLSDSSVVSCALTINGAIPLSTVSGKSSVSGKAVLR